MIVMNWRSLLQFMRWKITIIRRIYHSSNFKVTMTYSKLTVLIHENLIDEKFKDSRTFALVNMHSSEGIRKTPENIFCMVDVCLYTLKLIFLIQFIMTKHFMLIFFVFLSTFSVWGTTVFIKTQFVYNK